MGNFRVVFTTYDVYDIESDTEELALSAAERYLKNDRCRSVASTHYDDVDIINLDEEDD